ncbi:MAG TPA: HlyD family secretion protein [Burkholderiales bacterium]|nr:HlyD family secretion protein [Burkholderiales bacterium]
MASSAIDDSATPAHSAPVLVPHRLGRKQLKWIIAGIVLVVLAIAAIAYWREISRYVSTDDGYVQANQVEVTAQISGPVIKVYVRDQQAVKVGDPLFDIDPANYELALQKAQAQLELARQSVSQESASVASAQALLAQRRAEAANARRNWNRNQKLMRSGFVSPQGAENSRTELATAEAAVKAAEANVAQAKSALGRLGDQNANVQSAITAVRQAQLDLERTRLTSPVNGVVANLTLQPGNTVQPGVPVFVVISDEEYWIDANFKETELVDIHPGQKAIISSDVYPDRVFHGVVESLSGGSGTAFSLLPPQNATGNWVKVTQRVPVRIKVEDPDPQHPLRIGTTATVKVVKSG